MLLSKTLAAFLLACGVAATPPEGKIILGYRTCSEDEAKKINEAGRPVWETGAGIPSGGKQTGVGIYTSPNPGEWPQVRRRPYVCVIYANKKNVVDKGGVSKVWVPYKIGNTILWWSSGNEIADYVKSFPHDWNPARTLYLSWLQDKFPNVQLLIPPELIAESGGLGLSAVCKLKISDLPDTAGVNYDDWHDDIDGERGPQVSSGDMMNDPPSS